MNAILDISRPSAADLDAALTALQALLGDRLSRNAEICRQHGKDESFHQACPPDAVAFVTSTTEAAEVVKICAAHKIPMIPYGVGTSLEGHISALAGGVSIDMSRMNAIIDVHAEDMTVTVEAGVTRKSLNEYLRDTGLFFPIDPGADATIGGMTATRASGTNAVRYGTMRENVVSLTVVTPQGEIIKTASRARKSAAGYDLTRIYTGSEGTLGLITEITLKLYGIPEAISAAVCAFDDVTSAVNTVIATIQCGVPVARIELMDATTVVAVNAWSKLSLAEKPTLLLEFHGSEAGVREQAELVESLALDAGGTGFEWTTSPEARNKMWQARHNVYYATLALKPGSEGVSTDVCVPISKLAEAIDETRKDLNECPLPTAIVGHVGDGNFHTIFLVDPDSEAEIAMAEDYHHRMVRRAIALGGTCTGEHGIGTGKRDFLLEEHGAEAVALMRVLKQAFDPDNLMNPGKILP